MNSEEIRKALEIIKEPITVNCIEYKYFDQENYDKLTRVYDNCLWFVNNLEQINLILEQENQQLKSQYCERTDCSGRIGNSKKVEELEKENQKYKELIDKVIDLLDNHQNNLYSKQARETLDDDIELVLKLLKEVE